VQDVGYGSINQRLQMIHVSKFFIFFKTSFVRVGNETMIGFWHVLVLVARAKPQPTPVLNLSQLNFFPM